MYRTHETYLPTLYDICNKYNIELTSEDEQFLLFTTTDSLLRRVAPDMSSDERAKFREELRWREIEVVKEQGRLFDGVESMLASLSADGVTLAICGMGSKEYIDTVLTRCNIKQYFQFIYPRVEGLTKSQVLANLLAETKQAHAHCLMVGDSITDLAAARDNELPFIGVSYGYGADDIDSADEMAYDVTQLHGIILRYLMFSKIERDICNLGKSAVIGINGVDTSGKTMFSKALHNYLKCKGYSTLLLHIDDFHNPRSVRSIDNTPQGYIDNAFDLSRIVEILTEIRNGINRQIDLLDLDTDTYSNTKELIADENTIVILEGVLLYRPPIDQFFSYRIFIDINFDEVIRRVMVRDVPKYGQEILRRYKERYIPAQKIYLSKYSPKTKCDMVINNTDFNRPIIVKGY